MKSDHLKQNAAQVVMHIFLLQPKSAKSLQKTSVNTQHAKPKLANRRL